MRTGPPVHLVEAVEEVVVVVALIVLVSVAECLANNVDAVRKVEAVLSAKRFLQKINSSKLLFLRTF